MSLVNYVINKEMAPNASTRMTAEYDAVPQTNLFFGFRTISTVPTAGKKTKHPLSED